MKKIALIVVDLQNDFLLENGKSPVPGAEKLVTLTNKLIDACIKGNHFIVYTRDWHPRNHVSFRTLGEHCVAESSGALFHKDLNLAVGRSVILSKGTLRGEDSESAFGATDGFFNIEHFLDERGVTDLFVVGVGMDGCVGQTALEALEKNLASYVVTDASKARTSAGYKQVFDDLPKKGVNLVTIKDALKLLKVHKKQTQNV